MSGRVAVVTGAGRGFGRATSTRFAEEGARVALWDVNGPRVEAAAQALVDRGLHVRPITVDIVDTEAVDAAAQLTRTELGPVDTLVNNAAVVDARPPWEVDDASWDWHFAVNARGAFACVRACLPDMRAARYGKIINIGSIAAQQGRPASNPAYAASKGAILGLTVTLARNLGEFGICVNAVNPGFIRTDIHDDFSDAEIASLTADIPLQRRGKPGSFGVPDDIANACLFLASSESDYISGEFLSVNGASRTG